ncbi:hypothetical protein V8E53_004498 [Lactarius tabidus]
MAVVSGPSTAGQPSLLACYFTTLIFVAAVSGPSTARQPPFSLSGSLPPSSLALPCQRLQSQVHPRLGNPPHLILHARSLSLIQQLLSQVHLQLGILPSPSPILLPLACLRHHCFLLLLLSPTPIFPSHHRYRISDSLALALAHSTFCATPSLLALSHITLVLGPIPSPSPPSPLPSLLLASSWD